VRGAFGQPLRVLVDGGRRVDLESLPGPTLFQVSVANVPDLGVPAEAVEVFRGAAA